ncbi:transcription factor Opi1-domain-containing protein [Dissophora ornata]|nr:hypothetical protein BGZ58_008227 [Dissophora ornata]KAI8597089.1 transcription factor Opi1-domain-containing protein [Dissophora ornata]
MPSAKEMSKAQQMSISQLCQQDYLSDDELHTIKQDLDHDPRNPNSEDDSESPYMNGRSGYAHNGNGNYRPNGRDVYSQSSDVEEEFDQFSNHRRHMDEEQLAAEALGDMANSARPVPSAAPAPPLFSRMSSLPLVNSALKAIESGKQNSKVMKYGVAMVESSVKSLSKPVFEKLDDFASRQLDKVYTKSDAQPFPSPTDSARSSNDILRPDTHSYFAHRSRGDSIDSASSASSSRPSFDVLGSRSARHEEATLRQRSDSQSSQRPLAASTFQFPSSQAASNGHYSYSQQQQVGSVSTAPSQQFSGWRGVVATVGTASAAGVAIFSEESMRSLKYCLQWLQYAVHHIGHQIDLLRAFLVSLASPSKNTEIVPSTAASTLATIKNEVVDTLRKVINIVSRYAGACLPDHSKISVRQFILSMPVRWATLNNESVPSTPVGSPSLRPVDRSPEDVAALNETSERATRVLVLANESSDMLKSVSSIFKDSIDKAENWMDKLRYVGMNPQNNTDGLPSWAPTGFPNTPGNTMPGGFPGAGLEQYSLRQTQSHGSTNGHTSHGHITPTGSPTRSLKSSPRLGSRNNNHYSRHAYRHKSVMSGDEDSASDEEDPRGPLGVMDDDSSLDEDDAFSLSVSGATSRHGPMKRSMGSFAYTQDTAVRRRKKRGESAEIIAGLGVTAATNGQAIKQESM